MSNDKNKKTDNTVPAATVPLTTVNDPIAAAMQAMAIQAAIFQAASVQAASLNKTETSEKSKFGWLKDAGLYGAVFIALCALIGLYAAKAEIDFLTNP
ncbi:MAG TPA: hypothetical protein VH370_06665 [Humisphaera sp.]|jgi:hypothetical protein|nr:hypothetical protein [Humisphaera sp.]